MSTPHERVCEAGARKLEMLREIQQKHEQQGERLDTLRFWFELECQGIAHADV